MTVKDMITKLRVSLAAESTVVTEAKFADATLVDGTEVYTEGELEVGATLLIKVAEGEESPYAPEGLHETTDGKIISVGPNGEVMEISEVSEEAATEEEVVEEAMEEVAVEVEVEEEAADATEELLQGVAELIAPFTEEIAALKDEVVELKARFEKVAGESAAEPVKGKFSEGSISKADALEQRLMALRAIRSNK